MIADVETALKTKLAEVVPDWPIRWPNSSWPPGTKLSDASMPVDDDGAPAPAIEAEVVSGRTTATAGPKGKRRAMAFGVCRLYLSVAQGTGTAAITEKADAIADAFRRVTVWIDPATTARLITMDPRADDGVAAYEDGSRFCRMLSIPWDYDFPD
ncbi:hypothetical protein [Azospirillum thermophilum]|uniref:Uncharacterized protein n=1 Tax=Azospirillum thermophilum TaxID=2202148 RepID=A0A2S2CKX7_9PROT|nr:hypothetical protein [Azospirillum thermophilum]AWK85030.1 hypothetical protein DEW08_01490 [Azospirillum thermophilum]